MDAVAVSSVRHNVEHPIDAGSSTALDRAPALPEAVPKHGYGPYRMVLKDTMESMGIHGLFRRESETRRVSKTGERAERIPEETP